MAGTVIVLDGEDDAWNSPCASTMISWQQYAESSRARSLPRYVELNASRLREKYISIIYELGELEVGGKRIVDHLNIAGDFSYWWMTRLAEKSPTKSPRIFDCLRLLALEELIETYGADHVVLRSPDKTLAVAIQQLCKARAVTFSCSRPHKKNYRFDLRAMYELLPNVLQGLISARHIVFRWPLRKLKPVKWFSGQNAVFICSSFFHLDWAACSQGRFHAHQWEALPHYLQERGRSINWLHQYLSDPGMPSIACTLNWVHRFNGDATRQGMHAFLETYLSLNVLWKIMRSWLRLARVGWRLRHFGRGVASVDACAWLWPLLERDWAISAYGTAALSNCAWVELFAAALEDIPRQDLGFYVWANQGWECALVAAWQKNGHGQLVGVPHSTTPFWLLDLYDDPRVLGPENRNSKPRPHKLAVNGRMAWKALRATNYPANRLVQVEALRFQYLEAFRRKPVRRMADVGWRFGQNTRNVIVLGDYTLPHTKAMLRIVREACCIVNEPLRLTLKPHPLCPVDSTDLEGSDVAIVRKPLTELLAHSDFAFASNTTSAALDALLAGVPVAIFLQDGTLNVSPLRGNSHVTFVSSPEELVAALKAGLARNVRVHVEEFFWLDEELPKWWSMLATHRAVG